MSHNICDIEGIGPVHAEELARADIATVETLLELGARPSGRAEIASLSGLSEELILKWVNMADLFRIHGVGEEYSELLEASGVDSVKELATRDAARLTEKMTAVNSQKSLVRALPKQATVVKWIAEAKTLPPAVHH